MELTLNQISETLDFYFKGQVWKCVLPITNDHPTYDDFNNLTSGLEWCQLNDVPRPSIEQLQTLWNQIYDSGEYLHEHPPIPSITKLNPFYGKVSEYAQALLKDSDWAALPDVGLANQSEWDAYRASLRNIRSNPSKTAVFPQKPEVRYQ
jgi:hypothetical protein